MAEAGRGGGQDGGTVLKLATLQCACRRLEPNLLRLLTCELPLTSLAGCLYICTHTLADARRGRWECGENERRRGEIEKKQQQQKHGVTWDCEAGRLRAPGSLGLRFIAASTRGSW